MTIAAERLLIALLTAINFTHLLDFVVMMPLGPQLMRVLAISPQQFSWLVSSYTFSAAGVVVLSALVIDRFDRKMALLVSYGGFIVGTLFCAFAWDFWSLLIGRALAGAFGGMTGTQVLSIVGDVIPYDRRGRAMGAIMSAFSIASVLGIPIGLFLSHASDSGWRAPFFMIAAVAIVCWALAWFRIAPLREHLLAREVRGSDSAVRTLFKVATETGHFDASLMGILLPLSSFLVVPFIAPFMVSNVGLLESELFWIYLVGGIFTFGSARLVGRWSDIYGKPRVFGVSTVASILITVTLTHLHRLPVPAAIFMTTLFMMSMNARYVPAMAMISGVVRPPVRGAFMSVNACLQNLGSGIAAMVAGLVVSAEPGGQLVGYGKLGIFSGLLAFACIVVSRRVRVVAP